MMTAEAPAPKKQKTELQKFLHSWSWKREHRSDRDRFEKPYVHKLECRDLPPVSVRIRQKKFQEQGFASTVWDSSIVMAKYFEKHQEKYKHKRCLDLSAGCGLVGVVLALIGADVTATDLEDNLPLLRTNCEDNAQGKVEVVGHTWGTDVEPLHPPFDTVVACDVMYIREAVGDLVTTLAAVAAEHTEVLLAHGRNCFAEQEFMEACRGSFRVERVGGEELDEVYQCSDVTVLRLTRRAAASAQDRPKSHRRAG